MSKHLSLDELTLEADDILSHLEIQNTAKLNAQLMWLSKHCVEPERMALWLRMTYFVREDLPAWTELRDAAVSVCQSGEEIDDILFGLLAAELAVCYNESTF